MTLVSHESRQKDMFRIFTPQASVSNTDYYMLEWVNRIKARNNEQTQLTQVMTEYSQEP